MIEPHRVPRERTIGALFADIDQVRGRLSAHHPARALLEECRFVIAFLAQQVGQTLAKEQTHETPTP